MGSDDYKAMSREEELQQAADEWAEFYKHAEDVCDYISVRIAYNEGAAWADKHPANVWHDASEMPERFSCEILYEIRSENGFVVTYLPEGLTADSWFNILKVCGIVRWAYISDLLPKGVRNDNRRI